jgi:pimeloyl-ACP methyl ester carboxylesterase
LAERLRSEGNVLAEEPPALLSDRAPEDLRVRVRGWIGEQPPEAIAAAALGIAERPDSSPDLATIDVPTLVLTSTEDRLIAPEISAEMAGLIHRDASRRSRGRAPVEPRGARGVRRGVARAPRHQRAPLTSNGPRRAPGGAPVDSVV